MLSFHSLKNPRLRNSKCEVLLGSKHFASLTFLNKILIIFLFFFLGSIMFHVRRRPADGGAPRKRKKKPGGGPVGVSGPGGQTATGSGVGSGLYHHRGSTSGPSDHHHHRSSDLEQCPMFIELGADHVTESSRTVRVTSDVMEVGSANGIALQLYGPHIQPRHCLIQYNADSGITTLTPCHIDAFTYVNGQRIHQTTVLQVSKILYYATKMDTEI